MTTNHQPTSQLITASPVGRIRWQLSVATL